MEKKAVLKKMYNGISFFGKIYRNGDLTEKDALYLLKNHPAGEKLFDTLPGGKKEQEKDSNLEKLTKKQLIELIGESVELTGKENKKQLIDLLEILQEKKE